MDILLSEVINEGKDLIIMENNISYQITSNFNKNSDDYYNISSINLGELDSLIKVKYNISQNNPLIIFKIEKKVEGLLIPLIEYEIFNPETKEKLDLNFIENKTLIINIPIIINENNMYLYDLNSSYYNDVCNISYTEDGIDITLYERKNKYKNNNMSVCPNNCTYIDYNDINKNAICQCKIQNGITLDDKRMLLNVDISKSITSLKVVKCYKLLFSKEGLIKNIGSYIFLLILILYLILAFLFYNKGFDYLCNHINEILNVKNKEIENKDEKKFNIDLSDYSLKSKVDNKINYKINIDNKSILDLNGSKNTSKNEKIKEKISEISINYTDYEINNIIYEEAIEDDKRTYFQIYISILKETNILFFTFCSNNDYNSVYIKICLMLFIISLFLITNALFFNDSMMHKIYEDKGIYNFTYIIPRVIFSI